MRKERFEIEDNIPIPRKGPGKKAGSLTSTLCDLAIGQSVLVPGKNSSSIGSFIFCAKNKMGGKFTSRSTENGVRVWRVS